MEQWVTAWAMAQVEAAVFACKLGGRTANTRLISPLAGSGARITLANPFGKEAVEITAAALCVRGRPMPLTFGGQKGAKLAVGERCQSDAAPVSLQAGETVEIRLCYAPGQTPVSGYGLVSSEHSACGDHTLGSPFMAEQSELWALPQRPFAFSEPCATLCGLDLLTQNASSVAVLGDSNTFNGYWVRPLAQQLRPCNVALLNLGISGNRLLQDSAMPGLGGLFGQAAVRRFVRDLFGCSGLKTVVVAVGGNDLFQPGTPAASNEALCTAEQLLAGYEFIAKACRAQGLRVIGATLSPFAGAQACNEEKLARWAQVNEALRSGMVFDDVLDVAALLADPARLQALLPAYDLGDHLHWNEAAGLHLANHTPASLLLP